MRNSSSDRQFARAGLHAFEQAHVLDRDRRLIGECRDQLDLFVGERPHLVTRQGQDADRSPSRNIGTPRMVRKPPSFCASAKVYSGSARTSGICTTLPSSRARPVAVPRSGRLADFLTSP